MDSWVRKKLTEAQQIGWPAGGNATRPWEQRRMDVWDALDEILDTANEHDVSRSECDLVQQARGWLIYGLPAHTRRILGELLAGVPAPGK